MSPYLFKSIVMCTLLESILALLLTDQTIHCLLLLSCVPFSASININLNSGPSIIQLKIEISNNLSGMALSLYWCPPQCIVWKVTIATVQSSNSFSFRSRTNLQCISTQRISVVMTTTSQDFYNTTLHI
jgi:hypothetical protein